MGMNVREQCRRSEQQVRNLSSMEGWVQAAQDGYTVNQEEGKEGVATGPHQKVRPGLSEAAGRGRDNDGQHSHLRRARDKQEWPIALQGGRVIGTLFARWHK